MILGLLAQYNTIAYLTTNFRVVSPTLMKYIPSGRLETSICMVSAVMLPVIRF